MVIVIFVRPEDLPKFVRTVGKFYTDLQRHLLKIRRMGRDTLEDITQMDKIAAAAEAFTCETTVAAAPVDKPHPLPAGADTKAEDIPPASVKKSD